MKLICETCTINRNVTGGKRAFQKTILAIGKGSERKSDGTKIMLITTSNKSGTQYNVLKNISKIFTRFLEEGKATISFVVPEHDVQIKSDKVQLTAFLKVVKLVLTGGSGVQTTEQPSHTQSTTNPFSPSASLRLPCLTVGKKKSSILDSPSVLSTKCVVTNRKDYPAKGFSCLLVSLQISDIKLSRFDSQILMLQKLRSLNLSNNCIRSLPRALGQMRLCDLDLSGNSLTEAVWDWLLEPNIQSSLQQLNISNNALPCLPINVIYARELVTLAAENNHIRKLPFALWTMSRLRVLSLARNQIDAVPETLARIKLDRLDLSENELFCNVATVPDLRLTSSDTQYRQTSSLFELAARTVIRKKIPYTFPGRIPFTVLEVLRRAPLCSCGQPCFESKVFLRTKVIMIKCSYLVLNANQQLIADCVYCSEKCSRKLC
ncbi:leucine-rich repeat protein 1-like [Anopheles maculipalpis]|uniref:leucine-rich repeat protein 1-like n=1 Tax=Anopheles maculipalpis TaxID=1496333 RepID=UPI002158B37B|nr:leucine-rich repeat protein 1-like [Anopheles maculipalpis]